jgi:hypothetical protein
LSENDGCYTGLNQLELSVQFLTNLQNALNIGKSGARVENQFQPENISFSAGSNVVGDTNLLSADSKLCFRYYSLHPSQYAR